MKDRAAKDKGAHKRKRGIGILAGMIFVALLLLPTVTSWQQGKVYAAEEEHISRPSTDGQLSVEGAKLISGDGDAVALHGVSTHGITW